MRIRHRKQQIREGREVIDRLEAVAKKNEGTKEGRKEGRRIAAIHAGG
jgi:hypothetical protein